MNYWSYEMNQEGWIKESWLNSIKTIFLKSWFYCNWLAMNWVPSGLSILIQFKIIKIKVVNKHF